MTGSSNTIFIFGLGYVGLHLAVQLSRQGWQIIGTTRTPENLSDYEQRGWTILPFSDDEDVPDLAHHLAGASALVSTITAISGRDPVLARHKQAIEGFAGWTGYVSATSIYPDQAEGWVDETTIPEPATARGIARWRAEQEWDEQEWDEFNGVGVRALQLPIIGSWATQEAIGAGAARAQRRVAEWSHVAAWRHGEWCAFLLPIWKVTMMTRHASTRMPRLIS